MFPSIRQGIIHALVIVLSLSLSAIEAANAYPDQPIKIIVTFPPGGSSDIVIRALQPALSEALRQPIVIENRAGAGGNIGIGAVAQAAPDGYTLGVAAAGVLTVNPHLNPAAMPFDPIKDLAPVTLLAEIPFVLVASQQSAITSVRDLIAKAKAQPQGLSIGHGGNGTAMHLTRPLFNQKAGVGIQLIAYRGTAPVVGRRSRRPHPARRAGYPRVQAIDNDWQAESARASLPQNVWSSCPTFRRWRSRA
jgi:tripartite-type tricarboxylate transporter receptor subunit TctC